MKINLYWDMFERHPCGRRWILSFDSSCWAGQAQCQDLMYNARGIVQGILHRGGASPLPTYENLTQTWLGDGRMWRRTLTLTDVTLCTMQGIPHRTRRCALLQSPRRVRLHCSGKDGNEWSGEWKWFCLVLPFPIVSIRAFSNCFPVSVDYGCECFCLKPQILCHVL